MKYVGVFPTGSFQHMAPIPGHPMQADIDCSTREFPASFALAADFDRDGRPELVVAPAAPDSQGNDLWVMKYVGVFPTGSFQHMAPIPGHPMQADVDCSTREFPANFAVAADFDRDGRAELVVAPAAPDSQGNDLWVMKYTGIFPSGSFGHFSPIAGHPMQADIDCSTRAFPARFFLVGNYDGDAPQLMVAPSAPDSQGNDLWVLGFPVQTVGVINMIPNVLSAETNQDSEPNLAVNPANPAQIAGSAFTPNPTIGPAPNTTAPIYVSSDGGFTWALNNIVPSQNLTGDITVRFGSTSNNLYAGILRVPGNFTRDILRTGNFLGAAAMTVLVTRNQLDQPYVEAISVPIIGAASVDRVYVGNEDRALLPPAGNGRTATIDLSQNATTAPPSGFGTARIEQRTTIGRDGPPVRPAVHTDGTVYAVFYRWTATSGNFNPTGTVTVDVIVVRDDNWGAGANPFRALVDGGDNTPGQRVVQGRTLPWNGSSQANFGQERFVGSNISIAVDPRNSSTIYIVWADRVGTTDYTLHVRRSSDRGANWSDDLRTITNATNPALAINSVGKVAFLYQQVTGNSPNQRWDTHVEMTTDDWRSPPTDIFLATVPASVPVASFLPYIGDYVHIMSVGRDFFGIFSANNTPDVANFPNGVRYQRIVNFATKALLDANFRPVTVSIDPFFFTVSPVRRQPG
jgi:hypothetical protein